MRNFFATAKSKAIGRRKTSPSGAIFIFNCGLARSAAFRHKLRKQWFYHLIAQAAEIVAQRL